MSPTFPILSRACLNPTVKGIPRREERYGGSLAQVASEEHRDCMSAAETSALVELMSRTCNHHMLVHIEGTALEPHKHRPIRKAKRPFHPCEMFRNTGSASWRESNFMGITAQYRRHFCHN